MNLKVLLALGVSEVRGGVFLSNAEGGGPHNRINATLVT